MTLKFCLKTHAAAFSLLLFLAACGGNQKEQQKEDTEIGRETSKDASGGIGEAVQGMKGLSSMADYAKDMEDIQNTLKALKPISNDQLKQVLPATLLGIKRSAFSVGGNAALANIQMGEATYEKEDGSSIKLSVTDGAGETGASLAALQYMGLTMDSEKETEDGYEKNSELNGQRVHLEQRKRSGRPESKITFLADKRFVIALNGEGIEESELEKAMKELDLSALK